MKIKTENAINLFLTPAFRKSPWVQQFCDRIGTVFVTDDPVPYGHFCMYFGVHDRRQNVQYGNRIRVDLRTLHELTHWDRRHPIGPGTTWLDWVRSRNESEFYASVTSECMVYFHIPGLRELTFQHEIWVDRFLYMQGRPLVAIRREIETERKRVLHSPRNDDYIEFQIQRYAQQNMRWCQIWSEPVGVGPHADRYAFRLVEEHLAQDHWREHHPEWLESVSDAAGLPFPSQAAAFQTVVQDSNAMWGNQYLLR